MLSGSQSSHKFIFLSVQLMTAQRDGGMDVQLLKSAELLLIDARKGRHL